MVDVQFARPDGTLISQFRLDRMMEDWPEITFLATKEHHGELVEG